MTKMRIIVGLLGIAWALLVLGCEEEADPTYVWGVMQHDKVAGGTKFLVEGTLDQGGERYFGYCKYDAAAKKLSFAVGNKNPGDSKSAGDFYFEVIGITGEPTLGVYESGETIKRDEQRGFKGGRIVNGANDWSFDSEDIKDNCYAEFFGRPDPAKGELTPAKYGKSEFEYVVAVRCSVGLDDVPEVSDPNNTLSGFTINELWFKNCD